MADTPEVKVKKGIRRWLDARGAYYSMPIGSGFGKSGTPDFLACIRGTFVGIEAKAPGKIRNTTAMQDMQLAAIHKAGGIAIVVDDPAQLDTLDARLAGAARS